MIKSPESRVHGDPSIDAGIDDPHLALLQHEVVARVRKLLAEVGGPTRCDIVDDGPRVEVRLSGPPISETLRRALAVRVLDAVRAVGRTYGDVDVTYTTRQPVHAHAHGEEPHMQAHAGDRIVIKGHHIGEPDHDGEILEVRGADGGPPFIVRWEDTGHETLYFPGPDAAVQHFEHLGD